MFPLCITLAADVASLADMLRTAFKVISGDYYDRTKLLPLGIWFSGACRVFLGYLNKEQWHWTVEKGRYPHIWLRKMRRIRAEKFPLDSEPLLGAGSPRPVLWSGAS